MYRSITKSLTFRITLVICILILPINLFVISLSNQIVKRIESELLASYEMELAIYMTKIDESILKVDNQLKQVISQNWLDLDEKFAEGKADLAKYRFWEALNTVRDNIDIIDIAFLKTNWDQDILSAYDDEKHSYNEIQTISLYLKNENLRELSTGEYLTVEIDGRWYLMTVMNLSTYSVGVLLDVNRMLAPLRNVQEAPEEYFQLIDNTGNVIGDTTEILSIIEQESYLDIRYTSETIDYQLVRLISPNERKERMPSADRIIQIFAFLSLMIIPLLWWIIHHMMLKPLKVLDEGMRRIEQEDLEYRIAEQSKTREFQHLFRAFNTMSERIRTLTIEAYEKEVEKLEIETTNLRLQMNPHMLLNSLNMIYSFAQSKNHEYIKTFTLHLVHYFRYVLRKNTTFVTIEQEMDFVNNYMEIQKIRFPGAFTYVYDIEESLYDVLIPPLIIQNFVENSIKYGLKIGSEIEILITVRAQDKFLHISICDTGNGMSEERLEQLRGGQMIEDDTGQHIGIWNCRRRLNVIYGKDSTLTISSIPDEGTQVWIELPINRDDKIGENNDVINRR